jgi:hypothetical protein
MASFTNGVITNKGNDLKAKTDAGVTLELTQLVIGDGVVAGGTDLKTLNSLVNEVKAFDINSFEFLGTGRTKIRTILSNAGLITGFYAKEVGLMANDPDLGEILYSYMSADPADWIPPEDQAFQQIFDIIALTGNTEDITITLDPNVATLSLADMQEHELKQLNPADTNTVKEKHLSNAQAKVWQDHKDSPANPHGTTKAQVGLGNLPNAISDLVSLASSVTLATSRAVKTAYDAVIAHINRTDNPHTVTKIQVGLSAIPNAISDAVNLASSATLATSEAVRYAYNALLYHVGRGDNPHSVTKTQVGLNAIPNAISDSTTLASSTTVASSRAVDTVNDSLTAHKATVANPAVTGTAKVHVTHTQTKAWEDHKNAAHAPSNANYYSHPSTHPPSIIAETSSDRFVSDAEKTTWNGKANLGETSVTAYRGDRGKAAYDHSLSNHEAFPAGTSMLFNQASAPVGWTKKSNWASNASLIIGNTYGSGGSDSPSSWVTNIGVGSHAAHTHTGPNHRHTGSSHNHLWYNYGGTADAKSYNSGGSAIDITTASIGWTAILAYTSHVASGNRLNQSFYTAIGGSENTGYGGTGNTGSGGPTSHTVTQDTYTPRYQIVIAAIKN